MASAARCSLTGRRMGSAGPMHRRTLPSAAGTHLRPLPRKQIGRETKAEIRVLVRLVREEDFDVSKANAVNRLYQTLLQYIIVERGVYREDDLAQRIRELQGK